MTEACSGLRGVEHRGSGLGAQVRVTDASLCLTQMDEGVSRHHRGARLSLPHRASHGKKDRWPAHKGQGAGNRRIMSTEIITTARYGSLMLYCWQSPCALSHLQKPREVNRTDTLPPIHKQGIQGSQEVRSVHSHTAHRRQSLSWDSDPLSPFGGPASASAICWPLREVNGLVCLGAFASTALPWSPVF